MHVYTLQTFINLYYAKGKNQFTDKLLYTVIPPATAGDLVPGPPEDTKIHRCSSSSYKMAWSLAFHIHGFNILGFNQLWIEFNHDAEPAEKAALLYLNYVY